MALAAVTSRGREPGARQKTVRGAARAREILAVAEVVFIERGFADANMDEIAARANASKATIYKHFGNKEGMFAALVSSNVAVLKAAARRALSIEGALAPTLESWAVKTLQQVTTPNAVAIYRLVLSELHRAPELGKIFYDHSRGEAARQLGDFCRQATEAGRLSCPDPGRAGVQLAALVFSEPVTSTVMGVAAQPSRESLRRHAHEAVGMFLARYGVPPSVKG